MADVPAANITFRTEGQMTGTMRIKEYLIEKDGTGVTVPIAPGSEFVTCIGSELGYTLSSGTFTLKQAAGTDGDLYAVWFLTK
jgi:hypothetical protein